MHASLRVLLKDVIDYAGLFPPAGLDLAPAARAFLRYRIQPDNWMLARFVCPATKLGALAELLLAVASQAEGASHSGGGSGVRMVVSVVGRGGADPEALLAGLSQDMGEVASFHERVGRWALVDCLELKLCPLGGVDVGALLREAKAALDRVAGPEAWRVFLEPATLANWRADVAALTGAVGQAWPSSDERAGVKPTPGLKLRCGGVTAEAFPPADVVAGVIHACRVASAPLKFTAGLHHPLRRVDVGLQVVMHGFVNVFMAGVLAYALHLEPEDIQAVIEEQDARQFHFLDEGASWNDAFATVSEIAAARRSRVISFGSCSFDEPREDLRRLHWL